MNQKKFGGTLMSQIEFIANEIEQLGKDVSTKRWVQYTTGFDLGITEAENKFKTYKLNPLIINDPEDFITMPKKDLLFFLKHGISMRKLRTLIKERNKLNAD